MFRSQFRSQRYAIFCKESPRTVPLSVDLLKICLFILFNFVECDFYCVEFVFFFFCQRKRRQQQQYIKIKRHIE